MMQKRLITTILVGFTMIFSIATIPGNDDDFKNEINQWYSAGLKVLKGETLLLKSYVVADSGKASLILRFKSMRLAYKRISIITDYFNLYHTKLLNSPAIPRIEDDSPHRIIEPHGFQELEELLWKDPADQKTEIIREVEYILDVIHMLENEPDRINKFRNAEMWDSFYQGIVRLISLGITGFDSPVALLSIQECEAALEGMHELVNIYSKDFCCDRAALYRQLQDDLQNAKNYLRENPEFISFDRMEFIKSFMNPLSNNLRKATRNAGYLLPDERRSLSVTAGGIFEKDAFDINFFSPNKRYQLTTERVQLGKRLFYDPRLSGTGTRSCATCHQPSKAFTDGLEKAAGIDGHTFLKRNTPTLWNAVFQARQFYDSRQTMLEFQINDVVHNITEMKGILDSTAKNIQREKEYSTIFRNAYPEDKEPVSRFTISNAIASYVRSLTALNTRFDRYMRNEPVKYSAREKNGFNLFMGKAKCGTCHFAPLFNGLIPPSFSESESEVLGVPASKTKPAKLDSDSGKYLYTHSPVHLYSFKTPTVRNISLTSPYMHNGVFSTLEEVVDFYNEGGGAGLGIGPENQTLPGENLRLSKIEKKNLVLFLKTLTDTVSVHR